MHSWRAEAQGSATASCEAAPSSGRFASVPMLFFLYFRRLSVPSKLLASSSWNRLMASSSSSSDELVFKLLWSATQPTDLIAFMNPWRVSRLTRLDLQASVTV